MTHSLPLLRMRQIRKSFLNNEVLHGVDLDLQVGQVHALVGHNGAGKSTLMKVLAGFYGDYEGEITLAGQPLRLTSPQASLAAGIAIIHQEFSLVPAFTVAENLALGHEPLYAGRCVDRKQLRIQAETLLSHLGFDIPMNIPVGALSVAHQQLTEIAKALSRDARVLIMDEPTSRLALAERQKLFQTVARLSARGVGVIYISHFLEEVLAVADTLSVLRDGQRVHTGPASELDLRRLSALIVGTPNVNESSSSSVQNTDNDAAPRVLGRPVLELRNFGAVGRPGSTLTVRAGEIVGLAGLVGSGRTTLAESICGALPNHGHLAIKGVNIRLESPSAAADQGVVLVPEDRKRRGLIMSSSTGSNIVLTALSRRFSHMGWVCRAARQKAIGDAIRQFTVRGKAVAQQAVCNLSGGNQQKVLLARANVARPTLLVLDQPTAGVDIGAKQEIYEHIRALARTGVACLFVSDELEELLRLGDRVAIVRAGAIASELAVSGLSPHELLAQMSQTRSQ